LRIFGFWDFNAHAHAQLIYLFCIFFLDEHDDQKDDFFDFEPQIIYVPVIFSQCFINAAYEQNTIESSGKHHDYIGRFEEMSTAKVQAPSS
jgi:hypothetical protein